MNLDRLINRYLDGLAEPEEIAQLADLLKHDDAAPTRLAEHVMLRQHLEDDYRSQAIETHLLQGKSLENIPSGMTGVADTSQHRAAAPDDKTVAPDDKAAAPDDKRFPPSQPQAPASESSGRSRPSTLPVGRAARGVKVAAASMLDWRRHPVQFTVLAASVALVLWTGFSTLIRPGLVNPQHREVAEGPPQPDVAAGVVAWLASGDGARWDGAAPSGRGIRAGQELLLRSGLAEIQYATGVKVILAGPAEFVVGIDQSASGESQTLSPANSGYLALGTLVARVEGKNAKGFTVETAHARVVDLGTEFGVQVQDSGATEVVVLAGEVDLIGQTAGGGGRRIRLSKDQGASVEAGSGAIARRTKVDPKLVSAMRSRLQKGLADSPLPPGVLDETDGKVVTDAQAASQPNFVVILTDDHRADYLGCMGHPIVKTPNIDRLAAEGTLFRNAFVTSAACTPNRTCLLTGQYERKHGVTFGSASSLTEEAFLETYPMQLRKAGYYVGFVGKNHTPIGAGAGVNKKPEFTPEQLAKAKPQLGFHNGVMEAGFDYWYGNHNHSYFYPKQRHPIYRNARANTQIEIFKEGAMNFLKPNPEFAGAEEFLNSKPAGKPFCLLVNFNVPHGAGTSSMQLRKSDDELYRTAYRDQIDELPIPETYIARAEIQTPKIPVQVYNGKYISTYDYVQTEADLRERLVRTCQTVTGIDRLVGGLVAELKAQGLYDNTVVVFTSDHGLQFGEHGLGGKVLLYEESLRVPLIIFDPRLPAARRGTVSEELAVTIDIAPTLLELAGLPVHPEMQGQSLMPVLRQDSAAWRQDFFCENMFTGQNYPRIEGVRSKDFKYIRYFDKKKDKRHIFALTASIKGEPPIYEELYDLNNDPQETVNLAESSAHADILESFRKRCEELVVEAKGGENYPKTYITNDPRKR